MFKEAAHTRAFDGDVRAPQVGVRSEGDRAAVAALVNNYRATNVAIANIQRNLAEQIERSRRVNLVAGQLVMLGNVFNLAGAVANFTAAFGSAPKNLSGGDVQSFAELKDAIEWSEVDSENRISRFQADLIREFDELGIVETGLRSLGTTRAITPNVPEVVKLRPPR